MITIIIAAFSTNLRLPINLDTKIMLKSETFINHIGHPLTPPWIDNKFGKTLWIFIYLFRAPRNLFNSRNVLPSHKQTQNIFITINVFHVELFFPFYCLFFFLRTSISCWVLLLYSLNPLHSFYDYLRKHFQHIFLLL